MLVLTLVDAEGKARLWIRRLSSDTAQPMLETDGAINPFWSPDSQYVGFFAIDGKVRKILATGGDHSEAVTGTSWSVYGGTWGRTGTILFSSGHLGLYQVSASGGTAVKVPICGKGSGGLSLAELPAGWQARSGNVELGFGRNFCRLRDHRGSSTSIAG